MLDVGQIAIILSCIDQLFVSLQCAGARNKARSQESNRVPQFDRCSVGNKHKVEEARFVSEITSNRLKRFAKQPKLPTFTCRSNKHTHKQPANSLSTTFDCNKESAITHVRTSARARVNPVATASKDTRRPSREIRFHIKRSQELRGRGRSQHKRIVRQEVRSESALIELLFLWIRF
jgi:hypothetical protein